MSQKMKRGKHSKRDGVPVTAWLPKDMVAAIDQAVHIEDTDRSKFVRKAIRERVSRLGIRLPELQTE